MVIPSDITRWGFVKADPGEFQEIFFEGFYEDYKSGEWRLIWYDWNPGKECKVTIAISGHIIDHEYCSGPRDVYNLLKKVGYLSQIPTDANKENFT